MSSTKICDKCGEEKPRNVKHFDYAPRAQDKLTNNCRVCRGTQQAPEKKPASNHVKKPEKTEPEELPAIESKPEGRRICLDLTPELYQKIESWARTWNRTPQQQIVYHLASSKLREGRAA